MIKTNDVDGLFHGIRNAPDLEFAHTAWLELAIKHGAQNVHVGAIKNRSKLRQRDALKRERRYDLRCQSTLDELTSQEDVENAVLLNERNAVLFAEIESLPPNLAMAVSRHYLLGETIESVASDTGKPIGTIKSWIHRGCKQLKLSSRLASVAA